MNGVQSLSAYSVNPGKYDETMAYLIKFNSEFFCIEGYSYVSVNLTPSSRPA